MAKMYSFIVTQDWQHNGYREKHRDSLQPTTLQELVNSQSLKIIKLLLNEQLMIMMI